jgi:hypothetical protein
MLLGWPHLQGWGRLFLMDVPESSALGERLRFNAGIVLDLWSTSLGSLPYKEVSILVRWPGCYRPAV